MSQPGLITRVDDRGEIYHWEHARSRWPGHRSYVALEGLEVVVCDDFGRALRQTDSCHPRAFLNGCFHGVIRARHGQAVLDQVIKAVRARGVGLDAEAASPPPSLIWSRPPLPQAYPDLNGVHPPSHTSPTTHAASPPVPVDAARVDLYLTGAEKMDLTLFMALKGITGLDTADLRRQVTRLPLKLLDDASRSTAQSLLARLTKLGARLSMAIPGAPAPATDVASAAPAPPPKPTPRKPVVIQRRAVKYQVTVHAITGKKSHVVRALSSSVTGSRKKAATLVKRLPSRVAVGLSHRDAVQLKGKLEALGAEVTLSTVG